ncbi:MAG: GntR family transcriptional regulator [Hyphomicrobiaceae bacterium]|nr:GntR family transcriptional regulator [Hyphomicrobiaceae bacterium]
MMTESNSFAQMTENAPLYRTIADTLRREIVGGTYAVGDLFPKEFDLCDRFDVSRHTIRSALSRLEQEGLLKRNKATGTIIRSTEPSSAFIQKLASVDDLLQYPVETRLDPKSLDDVTADETVADWFEAPVGAPLSRIRSVRSRIDDGMLLCWSEIYVRRKYAGVFDEVGKDTRPVYRILQQLYDIEIARVEIELGSVAMLNPEAGFLKVDEGTPAMRVLRRYYEPDGSVFETSVSLHPQDRFDYKLTFSNAPAGG